MVELKSEKNFDFCVEVAMKKKAKTNILSTHGIYQNSTLAESVAVKRFL